jgi:hypothetical protein
MIFGGLLPRISTDLFSDLGDPLINTSILAWNAWHVPLTQAWWNFPAFAPLEGVTAFTEHFLLVYPVTSPVIWLTGNPVLAFNVVYLLVWPVNALAAYALVHELTGSRHAAFIGGLSFGFAPYMSVHVSHLQMLLLFGMPLSLLGLHRYLRTQKWTDAALFGGGWLATALASAYTLVFFPILLALWCVWFVRPREWRTLVVPAVAAAVASVPLIPLLLGYEIRQAAFGLVRSYGESKEWAADVTALAGVSHREWFWFGRLPHTYAEASLFPGLAIVSLAACGVAFRRVHTVAHRTAISRALVGIAGLIVAAVLLRMWTGPDGWRIGSMALPALRPFRAFTIAVVVLIAAILTTERFRASWRRRDPVMLFAVAAVFFWMLTLGPEPTWAGERILTYGPYRLFFELNIPAVVRVSARAWVVVLVCLSVLAGFGTMFILERLPRYRNTLVAMIAALVVAEGWFIDGTQPVPLPLASGVIPEGAMVLDVPFDDPFVNAAAQYRAVLGGYQTINGYSGYEAPHLTQLKVAFKEMRYDSIDQYHRTNDLYVIVRPQADPLFARWLAGRNASRLPGQSSIIVYRMPASKGLDPAK